MTLASRVPGFEDVAGGRAWEILDALARAVWFNSEILFEIALPDEAGHGPLIRRDALIAAGVVSDPAFDGTLALATLWDRAKAKNGGFRTAYHLGCVHESKKRRIVAESYRGGESATAVARRHGVARRYRGVAVHQAPGAGPIPLAFNAGRAVSISAAQLGYPPNGGNLEVAARIIGHKWMRTTQFHNHLQKSRSKRSSESTCERRARGASTGPENRGTLSMSLESDLSRLIRDQFDKNGISFKRSMRLERLTARYFEMTTRRIQPVPRDVHFSDQIHTSLGELSREGESDSSARDAWGMVFGSRVSAVVRS